MSEPSTDSSGAGATYSTDMTTVSARVRAVDAALRVASKQPEFRVNEVLAESVLPESKRRTATRALRDLQELGRVEQRTEGSPVWESNVMVNLEGIEGRGNLRVLHVFADRGVEAEVLTGYGEVVRIGWNARDTNLSRPVKADARHLPISPDVTFDLVVCHPPCARWSPVTKISGDPEDHPNLVPKAREIGEKYGDHYIIENVPQCDALRDPVTLDARMFSVPLAYRRSFETSFPCGAVPEKAPNVENECSPYFYSDRSRSWWASTKGYTGPYTKTALAKNAIPAPMIHWLMRQFLEARDHEGKDGSKVVGHDTPAEDQATLTETVQSPNMASVPENGGETDR